VPVEKEVDPAPLLAAAAASEALQDLVAVMVVLGRPKAPIPAAITAAVEAGRKCHGAAVCFC